MPLKAGNQNSPLSSLILFYVWAPFLLLADCSFCHFLWLCEPVMNEVSWGKPKSSSLEFLLLSKKLWRCQVVPSTSVKADKSHGWNWTLTLIFLVYIHCKTHVSQMDSFRITKPWEVVIDGKFQENQLTPMRKSPNVKTLGELAAILNAMMRWIIGI